jgi:hypothetical protein
MELRRNTIFDVGGQVASREGIAVGSTSYARAWHGILRHSTNIRAAATTLGRQKFLKADERFAEARRIIALWIERRIKRELGKSLPSSAFDGQPFEIDSHGQRYGAITCDDLGVWAARFEHNDARVPTRVWTVDVAIRRVGDEVLFLERCLCSTSHEVQAPVPLAVQRVVRELAEHVELERARITMSARPCGSTTHGIRNCSWS